MYSSYKEFIKRSLKFFSLLRERGSVSASVLAAECGCSHKTALGLINFLIEEYEAPVKYDQTQHGFILTDSTYTFTPPPVDQSELNVLLLLHSLAVGLDATCLATEIEGLWEKLAGSRVRLKREAHLLAEKFSCDTTEASLVKQSLLLPLTVAAKEGQCLRLVNASPWKQEQPKEYLVTIQKVRLKDGALYLLARTHDGKERVFNASYIKELSVENDPPEFKPLSSEGGDRADHFDSSFGIWAGDTVYDVVITFAPEASHFYAGQRWHAGQQDVMTDGVLVRTLQAILSPELHRRLLSIAPHIIDIKPVRLKQELVRIMERQIGRLREEGGR